MPQISPRPFDSCTQHTTQAIVWRYPISFSIKHPVSKWALPCRSPPASPHGRGFSCCAPLVSSPHALVFPFYPSYQSGPGTVPTSKKPRVLVSPSAVIQRGIACSRQPLPLPHGRHRISSHIHVRPTQKGRRWVAHGTRTYLLKATH